MEEYIFPNRMYRSQKAIDERRFFPISLFFLFLAVWVIVRLFVLQIYQHDYYATLALDTHDLNKQIHPQRGQIYFSDSVHGTEYPAAINKDYYTVYAVPKEIQPGDVGYAAVRLADILAFDDVQKQNLFLKLGDASSSYKQIMRKVPEDTKQTIEEQKLPGIHFSAETYRYYPEQNLAGSVLGFSSYNDSDELQGKYGLEGFFDKELSGKPGLTIGVKGAAGGWIASAGRTHIKAKNGPDIYLTIDRALEYNACERLRAGMKEYGAKSASLVMMDPATGAILAMCSLPDFDPNNYSKTEDISAFNNNTIFTPYEPGSVFKTITMAAGLDMGVVTPDTTYTDPCSLTINGFKVRNAQQKCYGLRNMTEVLENSINTGAAWVEDKVGDKEFYKYVKKFGFGEKTGIPLDYESSGDISSLTKKGKIFFANGSFGQGLTATPLQVAGAYSAIANRGTMMKPYIVAQKKYDNGQVETTKPEVAEPVISDRAARLLSAMLVSVVENHYNTAKIDHYYVAGKTGTAQIAEKGGYSATSTNQTFAGFAPATNPKFTLVVKFEKPDRLWAEQTALHVFKDVMKFALDYYGVPGDR